MSTYKTHCCRKIGRRAKDTWDDNVLVMMCFIFLVSLSLLVN